MRYYLWTEGCQMNSADSFRLASALEQMGYEAIDAAQSADVVVLNTCVVRQSAEDKAYGRLTSLLPLKKRRPDMVIAVMGCLVGRSSQRLREAWPQVDIFAPPSEPAPLLEYLAERHGHSLLEAEVRARHELQDSDEPAFRLPAALQGTQVAMPVPIVYGCSHGCAFCVIPARRGAERSRPMESIIQEVRSLVEQGVREVTLLGQIVDRYGRDLAEATDLPLLLQVLSGIDRLERIRFLTSHPSYMTDALLEAVALLAKVCEHIEVPVQAGDDDVLLRMKRGYTSDDYRRLVERIRRVLPGACIATDIIVGFPGETERQYERTRELLEELQLDTAHLARYSVRPGTLAARARADDVPEVEKMRRFRELESLQTRIAATINSRLLGQTVEVLVEGEHKGKWKGRTRTNKLVFFADPARWTGRVVQVRIEHTSPWSLQGELVAQAAECYNEADGRPGGQR
jgi:tRNA-2-methylthio-N6-dimethylallyladenosine synthase